MLIYALLCCAVGHPVSKFVPSDVPIEKLALLGAATDWCVVFPFVLSSRDF